MRKINHTLDVKTFAKIFNIRVSDFPIKAVQASKKLDFNYQIVSGKDYEEAILRIIKRLDSQSLTVSGPHRLKDWEKGWKENLEEFEKSGYNLGDLVPKFVRKDYIRFQGNLINPDSKTFETDFVTVLRYSLFHKYYKGAETLYEFGAGTGLNLVAASELFPTMKLVGLDWSRASIDIINSLKKKLDIQISGKTFNLFNPDKFYKLNKNSAVLTIGTLEQLGRNFKPFINYLIRNKPKVCIHFETLYELYNPDNLLDYLAIRYLEQRNYLKGFLPYLKKMESEKKIKIIDVRRTFGSLYHEGYTFTIWKAL